AIDGESAHADREPGKEEGHARHVPIVLARSVDVAQYHVVHQRAVQMIPCDQRLYDERRQIVRPLVFQYPTITTDRGANSIDNNGVFHGGAFLPASQRSQSRGAGLQARRVRSPASMWPARIQPLPAAQNRGKRAWRSAPPSPSS